MRAGGVDQIEHLPSKEKALSSSPSTKKKKKKWPENINWDIFILFYFFFYSYVHTMFGSFLPPSPPPPLGDFFITYITSMVIQMVPGQWCLSGLSCSQVAEVIKRRRDIDGEPEEGMDGADVKLSLLLIFKAFNL
jgi:hypothetical protein